MGKYFIVNTIYEAYMGEVNKFGIGAPCIFLRLAGCNLECYHKTMGTYCDTPEALTTKDGERMSVNGIIHKLRLQATGRSSLVCITGGEPLRTDITELLSALYSYGYDVVIETNGTRDISNYKKMFPNVSFVVDVKTSSTGVDSKKMWKNNYLVMGHEDYVKFVINDKKDYDEMLAWLDKYPMFEGNVGVGLFWGSEITYKELSYWLMRDRVKAYLNMQAHKMGCLYDYYKEAVSEINIPRNL